MKSIKADVRGNKIYVDGKRAKDLYPVRSKINSLKYDVKSTALDGLGDFGRSVGNSVRSMVYYCSWIVSKIATICVIIFGILVAINVSENGLSLDILHTRFFFLLAGAFIVGVVSNIAMNITA